MNELESMIIDIQILRNLPWLVTSSMNRNNSKLEVVFKGHEFKLVKNISILSTPCEYYTNKISVHFIFPKTINYLVTYWRFISKFLKNMGKILAEPFTDTSVTEEPISHWNSISTMYSF